MGSAGALSKGSIGWDAVRWGNSPNKNPYRRDP